MDKYVELARNTIDEYVMNNRVYVPSMEELTDEMMTARAGAFVSLHEHGELRGCIGTIEPIRDTLTEEIVYNAISAATRDPRFPEITPDELDDLVINVDILTEPEKISSPEELDVKRYGVIVQKGWKRGLLLPDLEGVDTVDYQIAIAKRKAGIAQNEPGVEMYRFEVIRHE